MQSTICFSVQFGSVQVFHANKETFVAAGAIPFLALSPPIAQSLPFLPADLVASAALLQLGYGASIASFLGGIHWALAMAQYGGTVSTLPFALCFRLDVAISLLHLPYSAVLVTTAS